MAARGAVRFCNNPLCERLDLHVPPRETLRKAGRDVCPACHEELVTLRAPSRPPRAGPRRRGAGRRRHEEDTRDAAPAP